MKSKLKKMRKKKENPIARFTYRIISERIAFLLSKTSITPNQVSAISVLTSIISGFFFSLGSWNYLLVAFIFLQLTILLDHTDGNLARLTNRSNIFGEWVDGIANKLHRFFLLVGASIGVFRSINNPLYLILGAIAIFNWNFSGYISETKRKFNFKKSVAIFKESNKTYFPVSLILYNLLGLSALINKVEYALWFFSIFGFVWIKQIYAVHKQWSRGKLKQKD